MGRKEGRGKKKKRQQSSVKCSDADPFLQSRSKYGEIGTINWLMCYLYSKLTCYVILMVNSTGPHEWLLHTSTCQKPFAMHTSTFASVSKNNSVSVFSIMCFLKEKMLWASAWKHLGAGAAGHPFYMLHLQHTQKRTNTRGTAPKPGPARFSSNHEPANQPCFWWEF